MPSPPWFAACRRLNETAIIRLRQSQPRWRGRRRKISGNDFGIRVLIEGRRLLIDGKEEEARPLFMEALSRRSDGTVNQAWARA